MSAEATTYHIPVLLKPSVDGLNIRPDGVYVDVTFGGGGHSREILSRLGENGRLLSFYRAASFIHHMHGRIVSDALEDLARLKEVVVKEIGDLRRYKIYRGGEEVETYADRIKKHDCIALAELVLEVSATRKDQARHVRLGVADEQLVRRFRDFSDVVLTGFDTQPSKTNAGLTTLCVLLWQT